MPAPSPARLAPLAALLLLSACATWEPTRQECAGFDWYATGVQDGAEGRALSRFDRYRTACAKVGVRPDHRAWLDGHGEGLRRWCTPQNAFRRAQRGYDIRRTCGGGYADLDRDVRLGLRWRGLEQDIHRTRRDLRQAEHDLRRLPEHRKHDRDRKRLRREIRRLSDWIHDLEREQIRIERRR